jgi:hypothetical protein
MTGPGRRAGAPSLGAENHVLSLDPVPESSLQARQFAARFTDRCGFSDIVEDVSLCAAELATNALLHTRDHFVLTVRSLDLGVRLDVMDFNPEHLPALTPNEGSAVDLTTFGNSGRGLQIVAALAHRWGVFTTDDAKTVWAEITGDSVPEHRSPIVALGQTHPLHEELLMLHYLHIPVRAAVSSGIQVEDLLREIQLERDPSGLAQPEIDHLFSLLDRSASVRLGGRHAALRAAAEGKTRFDLHITASHNALAALEELAPLLRDIGHILTIPVPALGADVVEFREWLNGESVRQRRGLAPAPCRLAG